MIGEFAALGAAISWAVAPIMYKKALSGVAPVSANIVRCATNASALLFILIASGLTNVLIQLPLSTLLVVIVSGIIGLGLGDTIYMFALKTIGVSRAVPLASTYPLFALIWATILLGETVTALAIAGMVLILAGIWLLSREEGDSTIHFQGRAIATGVGLSLLTAVVWSVSITLMDYAVTLPGIMNSIEANYAIVTVRITGMALVLLALAPLLDRKRGFLKLNWRAIVLLCVGGLVANGLGWLLLNYSFLNIAEAQAVPISSTTPLFSMLAGLMLFHEKMTRRNTLGALLVVLGVVLIFIV
ncbi:MAG TPA: DMT family transporter [Candidatus Sulfotelmatobacter sp.]|nr:DMT family transporter [Candidatus Sulfotelmatobacter sp.]